MAVVPDRRLALAQKLKILETNARVLKDAQDRLTKIVNKESPYLNDSDEPNENKEYNHEGDYLVIDVRRRGQVGTD
jgi:hypothetical protein